MKFSTSLSLYISSFLLIISLSVSAQTIFMHDIPEEKPKFGIRYLHPNFNGPNFYTFLSGTYDIYLNMPISSKYNLEIMIPFTHYDDPSFQHTDDRGYVTSFGVKENAFGNVYLGIQRRLAKSGNSISFLSGGIYLPTSETDKVLAETFGSVSNMYEVQRIIRKHITISTSVAYHRNDTTRFDSDIIIGLEAGTMLYLPLEKDYGSTELKIIYGASFGFNANPVSFFMEILGMFAATEKYDCFSHNFDHYWNIIAAITPYKIRPSIVYSIPLDREKRFFSKNHLGFKIEFSL